MTAESCSVRSKSFWNITFPSLIRNGVRKGLKQRQCGPLGVGHSFSRQYMRMNIFCIKLKSLFNCFGGFIYNLTTHIPRLYFLSAIFSVYLHKYSESNFAARKCRYEQLEKQKITKPTEF